MTQTHTTTQIAIVGAGPIGLELAISLERANIDYLLIEAGQVGDFFMQWPPETHFFSTSEHVALAGIPVHNLDQRPISGEQYLAYLRMLVEMFDLNLRLYEPVTHIQRQPDGFILTTAPLSGEKQIHCQQVVLATGGMAAPRLLNIPGEDLPNVTHYYPGPHPYFRQRLLVVGGRNSAVEGALRSWRAGAQVALSYRRPDFNWERIKPHMSMDLGDRLQKGEITFYPSTVPVEITPTHVVLEEVEDSAGNNSSDTSTKLSNPTLRTGRVHHIPTDFVYLATGFVADMSLFAKAGVELDRETEAPTFNPDTMETNVPGLYVAGTAAGGTQSKFTYFISTSHHHVAKIMYHMTGLFPEKLGTITARNNAVTWEEVKAN
ncbi:MAG: pyridine nucleotide-disulfide oxidoreductase [Chloroflexi bacterium]|nr:MAG: pyridine nucleotide-disulfide oxidoreductase [Chloroflexota bacterium]